MIKDKLDALEHLLKELAEARALSGDGQKVIRGLRLVLIDGDNLKQCSTETLYRWYARLCRDLPKDAVPSNLDGRFIRQRMTLTGRLMDQWQIVFESSEWEPAEAGLPIPELVMPDPEGNYSINPDAVPRTTVVPWGITAKGRQVPFPLSEQEQKLLDDLFTYHAPSQDQIPRYNAINEAAKEFCRVVMQNTQPCADRSAAIRLIREARMTANAAIALEHTLEKREEKPHARVVPRSKAE